MQKQVKTLKKVMNIIENDYLIEILSSAGISTIISENLEFYEIKINNLYQF